MRWASQVVVKDNEQIASLPREHDAYGQSTVITGVMRTDQKPCLDHSKKYQNACMKNKMATRDTTAAKARWKQDEYVCIWVYAVIRIRIQVESV